MELSDREVLMVVQSFSSTELFSVRSCCLFMNLPWPKFSTVESPNPVFFSILTNKSLMLGQIKWYPRYSLCAPEKRGCLMDAIEGSCQNMSLPASSVPLRLFLLRFRMDRQLKKTSDCRRNFCMCSAHLFVTLV